MLEVQKWLMENSFESLTEQFGISVKRHETLPLAILNYSQTDSPKYHPIVRECRGLTLHTETLEVVARAFPRFFNLGENPDEHRRFRFDNCEATSKEDGSLLLLYKFDGKWRINSRNGFGDGQMEWSGKTWEQGFCQAVGINSMDEVDDNGRFQLSQFFTYVLEFCSPWNKIVRRYETPRCYLLTMYCSHTEALPSDTAYGPFHRPERYSFSSANEVQEYLKKRSESDPTFEGVVLRDCTGMRIKVKSETYIRLHRIRGNNGSIVHPKHLIPFIMSGESDELLAYFPEVLPEFLRINKKVSSHMTFLWSAWEANRHYKQQKDFAFAVKDLTLAPILFTVRKKHGPDADMNEFMSVWRESGDLILNRLFK